MYLLQSVALAVIAVSGSGVSTPRYAHGIKLPWTEVAETRAWRVCRALRGEYASGCPEEKIFRLAMDLGNHVSVEGMLSAWETQARLNAEGILTVAIVNLNNRIERLVFVRDLPMLRMLQKWVNADFSYHNDTPDFDEHLQGILAQIKMSDWLNREFYELEISKLNKTINNAIKSINPEDEPSNNAPSCIVS